MKILLGSELTVKQCSCLYYNAQNQSVTMSTKAKQFIYIWKKNELSRELVLIKIWLQIYIFVYIFSSLLQNIKS